MKKLIPFLVLVFLCACKNDQKLNNKTNQDTIAVNVIDTNYTNYFANEQETFTIAPNKKSIIKGEQGTIITFPKDCFTTPVDSANVELIECYTMADMIKNRLSTITNKGELLMTDGMIYINATDQDGNDLKLKKEISVKMPTKKYDSNMKLFEAKNTNPILWDFKGSLTLPKTSMGKSSLSVNGKTALKADEAINTILYVNGKSVYLNDSIAKIKKEAYLRSQGEKRRQATALNIKRETVMNNMDDYFYSFRTKKLASWCNIDAYMKENKGDLIALDCNIGKDTSSFSGYYFFIYDNYDMIIPGITKNGKITFAAGALKNQPVKLVGLKKYKGDSTKVSYNLIHFKTSKDAIAVPPMRVISKKGLNKEMEKAFGDNVTG